MGITIEQLGRGRPTGAADRRRADRAASRYHVGAHQRVARPDGVAGRRRVADDSASTCPTTRSGQRAYVERLPGWARPVFGFDAGMIHPRCPEALAQAGMSLAAGVAIPAATPFRRSTREVIPRSPRDQGVGRADLAHQGVARECGPWSRAVRQEFPTSLARAFGRNGRHADGSGAAVDWRALRRPAGEAGCGVAGPRRAGVPARQQTISHVDDDGYFTVQVLGVSPSRPAAICGRWTSSLIRTSGCW